MKRLRFPRDILLIVLILVSWSIADLIYYPQSDSMYYDRRQDPRNWTPAQSSDDTPHIGEITYNNDRIWISVRENVWKFTNLSTIGGSRLKFVNGDYWHQVEDPCHITSVNFYDDP